MDEAKSFAQNVAQRTSNLVQGKGFGDEGVYRYGEINKRKAEMQKKNRVWFDQYGVAKRYITAFRPKTKIFAAGIVVIVLHVMISYLSPGFIDPDSAVDGYWMFVGLSVLYVSWYWSTILAPDALEAVQKFTARERDARKEQQ